jgi:glycosyltransferase involved in cell wall biosynthesis
LDYQFTMTDQEARRSARGQPISVVIPVYNFAHGIQQFLDMWRKPIEEVTQKSGDVLVVDDASIDATPSIVESYATRHPEVNLLRHEERRGLGVALQSGIARSQHSAVLILWPDWGFQPSDLASVIDGLAGADVVAPVRPGTERRRLHRNAGVPLRFFAEWVLGMDFRQPAVWYGWRYARRRLKYRTLFGLRLQDPTCGLRLVRRSVLDRCPVQSHGEFALVEMYAKANFVGALFHEVQLKGAGTAPVMRESPGGKIGDQKQVFWSPTFNASVGATIR